MRYQRDSMNKMLPANLQEYLPTSNNSYGSSPAVSYNQGNAPSQHPFANNIATHQSTPWLQAPLPSGYPTGGTVSPLYPTCSGLPNTVPVPGASGGMQMPVTVESALYTPGFLRTQLGRKMKVEFLIGTNGMTDRTGTLMAVGASYIIIKLFESDDLMMCDIYSIKFVTIYL